MSLGQSTVCGLSSGEVDCGPVEVASAPGSVVSVALTGGLYEGGRGPAFALLEDGSLFELMPDQAPMSNLHYDERIGLAGPFSTVASDPAFDVVCALGMDNIPQCCDYDAVSADSVNLHAMPLLNEELRPVAFTSLFGGHWAMCGLLGDGSMRCWGDGAPSSIPDGVFVSGHAGGGAFCGLQESGEVTCSGSDFRGHVSEAPAGRFVQLAFSASHACAIREGTGELVCWGDGSCASNSTPTYCTYPEAQLHVDE